MKTIQGILGIPNFKGIQNIKIMPGFRIFLGILENSKTSGKTENFKDLRNQVIQNIQRLYNIPRISGI